MATHPINPTAQELPTFGSLGDNLRAITQAQRANFDPPRIITVSGAAQTVYDSRRGNTLGDSKSPCVLLIQNLGTNPIKVAINQAAQADSYHTVLAPGSAAADGTGGERDFSKAEVQFISILGTAADKLSVTIAYPLDSIPQN